MRYVGWVLGGLFLVDGLVAVVGKRDWMRKVNSAVGSVLPHDAKHAMMKAANVSDEATMAMGINNLIAGTSLVLVSALTGGGHRRKWWKF
ncbi:MAG: hypothetical protein ACYDBB_13495 [Armatimonadota bacterium]